MKNIWLYVFTGCLSPWIFQSKNNSLKWNRRTAQPWQAYLRPILQELQQEIFNCFVFFLPPGTVDSLPAGHRARRRCDDCFSYSERWCLSTRGRSDEWWSSGRESCEPVPWCLHHSPPEHEHNRRSLVYQVLFYSKCKVDCSKTSFFF